jgi:hypothetical protein
MPTLYPAIHTDPLGCHLDMDLKNSKMIKAENQCPQSAFSSFMVSKLFNVIKIIEELLFMWILPSDSYCIRT